jgi:hypothetical protein
MALVQALIRLMLLPGIDAPAAWVRLTNIRTGRYNVWVLTCVGVNWIRRGSRGRKGMPSSPGLVKIADLNITADNQLALAA